MSATGGELSLPGAVNAHSHAFHRVLRGRTHHGRGSFWTWRNLMYNAAGALTPELYERLAIAVYLEMLATGYTAVGEFHYVHHAPDASAYPEHEMEHALARAAQAVGIRLVLLDTCYLDGGFGDASAETDASPGDASPGGGSPVSSVVRTAPNATQRRFSDGSAQSWLQRHRSLQESFAARYPGANVSVASALHSVRAVAPEQLRYVAEHLDSSETLHIHLSEQPAENADCLRATGLTPTGLLEASGLLSARLSAVHATHLTAADIGLLGAAQVNVVMCPTTEADLADGIGPALALRDAGAVIALGSDQHAVVDPWQEARALEYGERLATGERGRFSPEELLAALHDGGSRSLGVDTSSDAVVLNQRSVRTAGAQAEQIVFAATAADVLSVSVAGEELVSRGAHVRLGPVDDYVANTLDAVLQQVDAARQTQKKEN